MPQTPDDALDLHTIPASSSWFSWTEISQPERDSLPEFFSGFSVSRNPRIYKEYRDFIINKFRETPTRRLTFTEIRKSLVADTTSLYKLFRFLDREGIINFQVGDQSPAEPDVPVVVVDDVVTGRAEKEKEKVVDESGDDGFKLTALTSYVDVFGEWVPAGAGCGSCEERQAAEGISVTCSRCSKNENCVRSDLADEPKQEDHTDAEVNHVPGAWTDAETLLLLEAVLKHGEDWDLIAQHVRTKSKLDCIARLVQLPFVEHITGTVNNKPDNNNLSSQTDVKTPDHMLNKPHREPTKEEDQDQIDTNLGAAGDPVQVDPSKGGCFSFEDATRSLMQQVGLLSTVAGPRIAAASAEAAVTALLNENPYLAEAFNIDEDDFVSSSINKVGITTNNNQLVMESDIKVEDLDMQRHKQSDVHMEDVPEENFPAMTFRIKAAVATALGSAAARAKLLADQEEREMEHLMASIIETQMRKIQYKIKHFEELERIMEKESSYIQEMKEVILEDWVSVMEQAVHAGIPRWRDQGLSRSLLSNI